MSGWRTRNSNQEGGFGRFFECHGAGLVVRLAGVGIESGMSQAVDRGIVHRDEDLAGLDGGREIGGRDHFAAAGAQDHRIVIADAEDLLKATAANAGEKVAAARERIQDRIHSAKIKLAEAEEALVVRTREAARVTDAFVHDNPWYAVGIAASAGLIIGMLIGRR